MGIRTENIEWAFLQAEDTITEPFQDGAAWAYEVLDAETGECTRRVGGVFERTAHRAVALHRALAATKLLVADPDPKFLLKVAEGVEKNLSRNSNPTLRLVMAFSSSGIPISA